MGTPIPLAEEVRDLSDRVVSGLDAAYDYYLNTKRAWALIVQLVAGGQHFAVVDRESEKEVDEKVVTALARRYVTVDLATATLERFASLLEEFLVNLHGSWLREHPGRLSKSEMTLGEILGLDDKRAIVGRFIEKELRDFSYEAPGKWFERFREKGSAKLGCPSAEEIGRIAELKARRDLLVHNRGVVNWIYLDKSGRFAAYEYGDEVDLPDNYLRESWQLIRKIVRDMASESLAKLSRPGDP